MPESSGSLFERIRLMGEQTRRALVELNNFESGQRWEFEKLVKADDNLAIERLRKEISEK